MTRDELMKRLDDTLMLSNPRIVPNDLMPDIDAYVTAKMLADQKRRRYITEPDTVERPKRVGDLQTAIEGLADEAQMFIAISGHGEDYAVSEVWASHQIDQDDAPTVGLEIHLGLFPERTEARAES